MKLSTKSHYAVMAMIDLAHQAPDQPTTLVEISQHQGLPVQYLEQLFVKLRQANLVKSVRGFHGGYYLAKAAINITIAQIIDAVGEEVQATRCDVDSHLGCQGYTRKCTAHNLWSGLGQVMKNYLMAVTLDDVVARRVDAQGHVGQHNNDLTMAIGQH